ncbi:hypothetical protein Q1695_002685 [Nippostrongylus brasiliensis]|nr:hypothetical protein Q1695_002685 [Nippostrongylus brasiliensis]
MVFIALLWLVGLSRGYEIEYGPVLSYPDDIISLYREISVEKLLGSDTFQKLNDTHFLTGDCLEDMVMLINGTLTTILHTGPQKLREIDRKLIIPMFDSSAKLGSGITRGHLTFIGAYQQCREIDYLDTNSGRHILGGYYRVSFKLPRGGNTTMTVNWDVCLPASCYYDNLSGLLKTAPVIGQFVDDVSCGYNKFARNDIGFAITACLMIGIVAFCSVITAVDYYDQHVSQLNHKGKMLHYLTAFSFIRNYKALMDTDSVKKSWQIDALNGMRALSIIWVIVGHTSAMKSFTSDNPLDVLDAGSTYLGQILTNAYLAVDSFFFLGGLLVAFVKFKDIERNPKAFSIEAWIMFYIHRMVRLSPPYYILILFYSFIFLPWLLETPSMLIASISSDTCPKNWWINFLYLNNLYKHDEMCFPVSWYLATDFQMYAFSPILIMVLAIWGLKIGLIFTAAIVAVVTALNFWEVMYFYFPASDYFAGPVDPRLESNEHVFVIGMVVGYVLQTRRSMKISKVTNAVLWICCIACLCAAMFSLKDWNSGHQWPVGARASYSAFARLLWSLGLSWIALSCQYGYAGPMNTFMTWPGWLPFSRLCYSAFLVHMIVIMTMMSINNGPIVFSGVLNSILSDYVTMTVLTFLLALVWSLAFEIPFAKIEMLLFVDRYEEICRKGQEKSVKTAVDFKGDNENLDEKSMTPL